MPLAWEFYIIWVNFMYTVALKYISFLFINIWLTLLCCSLNFTLSEFLLGVYLISKIWFFKNTVNFFYWKSLIIKFLQLLSSCYFFLLDLFHFLSLFFMKFLLLHTLLKFCSCLETVTHTLDLLKSNIMFF